MDPMFSCEYFSYFYFIVFCIILILDRTCHTSVTYNKYFDIKSEDMTHGDQGFLQRHSRSTSLKEIKSLGALVNPSSHPNNFYSVEATFMEYGACLTVLSTANVTVNPAPLLIISKSIQMYDSASSPDVVAFRLTISHSSNSSTAAHNMTVHDKPYPGMELASNHDLSPAHGSGGVSNIDGETIEWKIGKLDVNETRVLTYKAQPHLSDGVPDQAMETVHYVTEITYGGGNLSILPGPFEIIVCSQTMVMTKSVINYRHGFTVLAFFLALLLGLCVIFIIILICNRFIKRGPSDSEKSGPKTNLLLDTKVTEKKDFNTITHLSSVSPDDSFVWILGLKDRLQMNREIDSLDIMAAISVDTDLEYDRNEAMFQATRLLIRSLRINGDITKTNEDRVMHIYEKNCRTMEEKLAAEYSQEREEMFKEISTKNKDEMSRIQKKFTLEKDKFVEKTKNLSDDAWSEMERLITEKHQSEHNDLSYKLKLEQDKKSEELRKKYSARKRAAINDLHQRLLGDVSQEGKLMEEQADWLIKEHARNCSLVEQMYDEELSRQRMILEEKLALRRFLAEYSELKEDDESECLNAGVSQQLKAIKKLKKSGVLSPYECNMLVAKVTDDMMAFNEKRDKELQRQQSELHKRLSAIKKQKMEEKLKENRAKLAAYDKETKEQQTDTLIDPVTSLAERLQVTSAQHLERSLLEDEIDKNSVNELEQLRESLHADIRKDISDYKLNLVDDLKAKGLSANKASVILKQHEKEMENLRERQREERERQKLLFMEKLENNRQNLRKQNANEKEDQSLLRHHEDEIVRTLVDYQLSLSEEDREAIMREHQSHAVKLENNLTLNKLRQKEMLEERLAAKRAQQMDKLAIKQKKELKDEAGSSSELELMKEHLEQKLALLYSNRFNVDVELEEVQVAMMKERAMEMRKQEEKFGEMITSLQINKAREMAEIEEKQTVIQTLQTNIMDELSERGVLTDPECQSIIERHRQQQVDLLSRLETQRIKQERILKEKLRRRLEAREHVLKMEHESEIGEVEKDTTGNNTMVQFKKVTLMQKQLLEVEQFRNHTEREISQNLEDMRRQFEIRKLGALQVQELQFISGLVRLGKFGHGELVDVLQMLFPNKSKEHLNSQLSKIYELSGDGKTEDRLSTKTPDSSRLREKVRSMMLANVPDDKFPTSLQNFDREENVSPKRKKKSSRKWYDGDGSPPLPAMSERPEPVGQDREEEEIVEATPTLGRMTPIDTVQREDPSMLTENRKKKRGGLKKMVERKQSWHEDDG